MRHIIGIGEVNDFQQKISISGFLQCGTESFDKGMRQLIDKSDCIGQKKWTMRIRCYFSNGCVKRCEQHVFFQYLFLLCIFAFSVHGQHFVQESGFTGIGIAYQ